MWIIDRYVLRQFLRTFVICYVSLAGIYIVFDGFTNLEDFMSCAKKQGGGLLPLMALHYGFNSIMFFDRTAGLLTLIAAMFTVTWIRRHNELTALMSAGISRIRVVAPVIGMAIAIALLSAVNRELVIPRFREQLSRKPRDLSGDVAEQLQPRYDNRTDILIRGHGTYAKWQKIDRPSFLLPPSLDYHGKQLEAKEAFWRPAEGDRPGGFLLVDVERPEKLLKESSLLLDGKPVIITPHDAPDWLKPGECFVVSEVDFEQLTGGQGWRQFSSTAELITGLRNRSLDFGADVRVAIHSRFVAPFLDVTLLFLGLPLVVSRESRNVFIAIGLCILVVSVFVLAAIAFQHLGAIYLLDPALAAWMPLLVFLPLAVGSAETMWE